MALPTGAYPFAQILAAIKARVVLGLGVPSTFVKTVASDDYKVTRVDPLFAAVRCFSPYPVQPGTGAPFGDYGAGRIARPVARVVRVYLHTRTGVDVYGDDAVALESTDPTQTVETADPVIKHLLAEEFLVNALDDFVPLDDLGVCMTIGPVHWIPVDPHRYPLRAAVNSEGLLLTPLDFQVVYLSAVVNDEPAPEVVGPALTPHLLSAAVDETGEFLTLVFDKDMTGDTGLSVSNVSPSLSITFDSGDGTTTYVFSLGRTVYEGESPTLGYIPGSVQSILGAPLEAFSGVAVQNGSTVPVPPVTITAITVASSGLAATVTFSQPVTGTSGFQSLAGPGGTVTMTYTGGSGTAAYSFSLGRTVYEGEILTGGYTAGDVASTYYTQPALATVNNVPVTNGSQVTGTAGWTAPTADEPWVVPAGVTQIRRRGGGAGGGGGGGGVGLPGAGGGGGGASLDKVFTVVPGSTLLVTVGAGGAGGIAEADGQVGGQTGLTIPLQGFFYAEGGGGGFRAGHDGPGGQTFADGQVGGNGGNNEGVGLDNGKGGGGSARDQTPGNWGDWTPGSTTPGAGLWSPEHFDGGGGEGGAPGSAGAPGTFPGGGGGGGGSETGSGGTGGDGYLLVSWPP